jgi:hypothetical protein
VRRNASSLSSSALLRMFWISFSLKGKRGISLSFGSLIALAGLVVGQPFSMQYEKNARRNPISLEAVSGDNFHPAR